MAGLILVVDDEAGMRETLGYYLESLGYGVLTAGTGQEAMGHLVNGAIDLILTDVMMPGMDGLEILRLARELSPAPAVILMTGFGTVENAVEAMRRGADDYMVKPFQFQDLGGRIQRLLATRVPAAEAAVPAPAERRVTHSLVGQSAAIETVRRQIERVAGTSAPVLVTGETGTGKELVARSIHLASPRATQPFVAVNCAAIPDGLFESTLFGHVRGAFTSAMQTNPGLIAAADRGTLFLDEIGETPVQLQVKLLRALEDKRILAVGRTTPVRIDCRIIASTNRDLRAEVTAGRFRDDLFYRLKVVHIAVPPLRSRREDIGLLAEHFMEELNHALGTAFRRLEPAALDALRAHDWPGNVRELLHVVESAMIGGTGDTLVRDDLAIEPQPAAAVSDAPLKHATRAFERQRIMDMLARTEFDKREAARRLGMSLASLYRKIDGGPR